MKLIKEKKIYTGDGVIENGYIRFDEKIEEVGDMTGFEPKEDDLEVNCAGTMVVPGFIDIHSHGGYGKDNMDATPDEIDEMVKQMTKQEGITTYFCTTMTQTYENIEKAMQNIHDAAQKNPVIKGIHVEGPFISTVFKGAQDPSYIKKPDENTLEKWNEISGGLIRIVTYAPEEADPSFETWCKENGVVLSAGHSNALYGELNASGATHVTHLYNAQRGLNHREPGVTGYGMLAEGVHAELICDGKHIVPDMVKLACKVRGYDGIELITDSMRAALDETQRRREVQMAYNEEHGITPKTIQKAVRDLIAVSKKVAASEVQMEKDPESMSEKELEKLIKELEKQMKKAAADLNFEAAAELRDKLIELKKTLQEIKI